MESTHALLRRVSRFNNEINRFLGDDSADSETLREHATACREAEAEIRQAIQQRKLAQIELIASRHNAEAAHERWRQTELDERLACSQAEARVWAMMADCGEARSLRAGWYQEELQNAGAPVVPANRSEGVWSSTFGQTRFGNNSGRFFTIRGPKTV